MGKSTRLRLHDIRRAFRLLGDCRDLGRDRGAWTLRAASGIRDSLDAVMTAAFHLKPGLPLEAAVQPGRSLFDVGWGTAGDRCKWLDLLSGGRMGTYDTVQAIYQQTGTVVVRSRDQLVDDRRWKSGTELNEDRKPLGQNETLIGILWHSGQSGSHLAVSVNRSVDAKKFDGRERAFLRLFLQEVHDLIGRSLAIDEAGPFAGLTGRAREVLEALLQGDAEKQIATQLGISGHTVHDYVKSLYRHFKVSSRGELSAVCYRLQRET